MPAEPDDGGAGGAAQGRGAGDASDPVAERVAKSLAAGTCGAHGGGGVALAGVPGGGADDADRRGTAGLEQVSALLCDSFTATAPGLPEKPYRIVYPLLADGAGAELRGYAGEQSAIE